MLNPSFPVAIVGGGIAGLTAAFVLQRAGVAATVFEASAQGGGVIRSERREGYLLEWGPHTLARTAPILEAVLDATGLRADRVEAAPEARQRYVARAGRSVALPLSPPALVRSPLFSARAKLRLLREPFTAPAPPEADESVAAFTRRRLGDEFLAYAVDPFVAGIFAGNPEQISVRHALPRLHRLEQAHGSLIRGMLRQRGPKQAGPRDRLFSFRHGLQSLPQALAAALAPPPHTMAPVQAVWQRGDGWQLRVGTAEAGPFAAVLLTLPLHRLPDLTSTPPLALGPLPDVAYPPVAVVALGFPRAAVAHPLDGFGVLVPAAEAAFSMLGTLFVSTLFPERAPAGHVLLTSFVGGARRPEAALEAPEALTARVAADLGRLLGITAAPTFEAVHRWPRAIPQYAPGYGRVKHHLAALEARHPGLFFTGNFAGGVAVTDTMVAAEAAAARLLAARGAA